MKTIMRLAIALSVVMLTLGEQQMLAATTYVVGTCKPSLKSFVHIQDALNATPPPTTVLVCASSTPYAEQITISQPVNLQGIPNGDAHQAVIAGPLTQFVITATRLVYFQIWVNTSGPVNISNLTVDGAGNAVTGFDYVAGIFFQNTPGSISRVVAAHQAGTSNGFGILLEGGSAVPTVTVTNNSVHGFDNAGIYSETLGAATSELKATISGNSVDSDYLNCSLCSGIIADQGATTNISGNLVNTSGNGNITLGGYGIVSRPSAEGSISGNTVVGTINDIGYRAQSDAIPVTGNKSFGMGTGIEVESRLATVEGNSIIGDSNTGIASPFNCNANPNVIHNTISDASIGLISIPTGLSVSNTYTNVAKIRDKGFCP